jgi:hypothetical protein
MKPKHAKREFEAMIKRAGVPLPELTACQGIGLMLAFYRDVPAADCDPDASGEMLLFEWGSQGQPRFCLNIWRQFTLTDPSADGEMSQLCLDFYYPLTPELEALGSGSQWCEKPSDLEQLETFITNAPAYGAVATLPADEVDLYYTDV